MFGRNAQSSWSDLSAGFRSRANFRRQLEAAAVNPHDAEPHLPTGLVYQQRRQTAQAMEEFQRAIAIDPTETDAHYQLGRIAREQGRLEEALAELRNRGAAERQTFVQRSLARTGRDPLTGGQDQEAARNAWRSLWSGGIRFRRAVFAG